MSVVLYVDFTMPAELLGEHLSESSKALADSITQEPGFISKTWIENKETQEAGGIYFFENKQLALDYIQMHEKRVARMGATNICYKIFDINHPLSKITKGDR